MTKDNYHRLVPDVIEKRYFTIGEIADELNVATSAIRFWCREFSIHPRRGLMKGRLKGERKFEERHRRLLHRIKHLLEVEQYTIKGAKRQLEIKGFVKEGKYGLH